MGHRFEEFEDAERLRLVELDLEMTNEFIRGVIATSTAVRGIAVTVWLALLGVALQQQLASLAVLACVVAAIFWVLDAYYGWLYAEASVHARACETLMSAYYNAISRAKDDPGVVDRFRVTLRGEHFGLFRGFRSGFGINRWWNARPTILYRTLYISMLGLSTVVALLLATGVLASDSPQPDQDPSREWHHRHDG
ncbi:hypothetical protein [Nocardioides caricicola]|uniref:SLATT domain-containing protein n=1 Tax=Nocardioides caricicola TaxID=634770 RepID=A0ABW0MZP7_9ACTN